MKTSYFAKYKGDKGIAICLFVPFWWKGFHYPRLAPTKSILTQYKKSKLINQTKAEDVFTKRYKAEVLDKLDPHSVYSELGEDAVLLCFEKCTPVVKEFCHRHLVSSWLNEAGYDIDEIEF